MSKNCESKPFIKLQEDNSNAPILNYNMEQENCMNLYSGIPFGFPKDWFKEEVINQKSYDLISQIKDKDNLYQILVDDLRSDNPKYFKNFDLVTKSIFPVVFFNKNVTTTTRNASLLEDNLKPFNNTWNTYDPYEVMYPMADQFVEPLFLNSDGKYVLAMVTKGNLSTAQMSTINLSLNDVVKKQMVLVGTKDVIQFPNLTPIEFDLQLIYEQVKNGKFPVFKTDLSGRITIDYLQSIEESKDKRAFFIQYELMQCSYLGNYGAAETIGTFSLLPGERTTISLSTYRDRSESKSLSENVLDSMSTASASSFEKALKEQNGSSFGFGASHSKTVTDVDSDSSGFLVSIFHNFDDTMTTTTTDSSSVHLNSVSAVVKSATSQHVNQSNRHRDINVNSTMSSTENSGESTSVIREIENPNISRTLNFVFRQLLQEHIVITWVKNIKFGFINNEVSNTEVVYSHNLRKLIDKNIKPEFVESVFHTIMKEARIVFNYDEQPIEFFENRVLNYPGVKENCDKSEFADESICLWVRTKNLEDMYANITVPGVIIGVQKHVLKTPSVIVDSLLGQGEALDCFNTESQKANIEHQQLMNQQLSQAISIIEKISDPKDKADYYKKVFGNDTEKNINFGALELKANIQNQP